MSISTTSAARPVVVQGDGKIVLAGSSDGRIALLRLNGCRSPCRIALVSARWSNPCPTVEHPFSARSSPAV